jgi:hypothetical protein
LNSFVQSILLWFEHKMTLHRLKCWIFGPQLLVLFWEMVETLRSRAQIEVVGHWRVGMLVKVLPVPLSYCFLLTMKRAASVIHSCCHDVLTHHGPTTNKAKDYGLQPLKPWTKKILLPLNCLCQVFFHNDSNIYFLFPENWAIFCGRNIKRSYILMIKMRICVWSLGHLGLYLISSESYKTNKRSYYLFSQNARDAEQ